MSTLILIAILVLAMLGILFILNLIEYHNASNKIGNVRYIRDNQSVGHWEVEK